MNRQMYLLPHQNNIQKPTLIPQVKPKPLSITELEEIFKNNIAKIDNEVEKPTNTIFKIEDILQKYNNQQTSEPVSETKEDNTFKNNALCKFADLNEKIEFFKNEFKLKRKVRINNFFQERFVENLYNFIVRMPETQFSTACGIRNIKYEKKNISTNLKRNMDNVNEANKTFSKGEFSYVFHRGMNNTPGEVSIMETLLRTFLNSNEFKEFLCQITDLDIRVLNTMFLSKYKTGHFLSPHSDKGNGKIAFVINLTKGWLPQYGGNLHFLSEDRSSIIETWTPAFNNMVIFYVPPEEEIDVGMPHFVGHVSPGVKLSRYAITGWYN